MGCKQDVKSEINHKQQISSTHKKQYAPCDKYQRYFNQFSNISRNKAQFHAESICNPFAVSPVGALGISQIMPINIKWLENGICRKLGKARPQTPKWDIECGILFMEYHTVHLYDHNNSQNPLCDNRFIDEQRYNGGYYILDELRFTNLNWLNAYKICGTRRINDRFRSKKFCKENYEYPYRIWVIQKKHYLSDGGLVCPRSSLDNL